MNTSDKTPSQYPVMGKTAKAKWLARSNINSSRWLRGLLFRLLVLSAVCLLPTAVCFAQGTASIRKGPVLPGDCDLASGAGGRAIFWKSAGADAGLFICDPAGPAGGYSQIPYLTRVNNGLNYIQIANDALTAPRVITLPNAATTLPVISYVLTIAGPTAARTITVPDANFTVARSDAAQTFIAPFTVSQINGGTTVGSSLLLQSTSGVGTTDFIDLLVGNNGGTRALRAFDSGGVSVGTTVDPGAGFINALNGFKINNTTINTGTLSTTLANVDSQAFTAMSSTGVFSTKTFDVLLLSTAAVDMNTATPTVLYTSPTGKSTVIKSVTVRNCSTSITTASYSFGWTSAAFTDVIANATHTELTGATLYTSLSPKAGSLVGTSTQTFNVLMNTLQGGAATCTMSVWGYTF